MRVSRRYAEAFLEYLRENKFDLKRAKEEALFLRKLYDKDPTFRSLFTFPTLSSSFKEKVVVLALKNISKPTLNLLRLLIRKHRDNLLPEVLEDFLNLSSNTIKVRLVVPGEVSERFPQLLKEALRRSLGKNPVLTLEKDPSILGGFLLLIEDELIDASLRRKLEKVVERLKKESSWITIKETK